MKPAACYLRCSTDAQEESVPAQRKQIERFAAERGFEVVEEFVDDGLSGTSTDRPRLQDLIEACEDNRVWGTIFIWDRSRLGRPEDPVDLLTITSRISKAGKTIVPVHGAQPTGDKMMDVLLQTLEFGQAGKESIKKSRDVLRGQRRAAEAGSFAGGSPPYGFDAQYEMGGVPIRRVRYGPGRGLKQNVSLDGKTIISKLPKGRVRMAGEKRTFVPSSPERVEIVRRIFREYAAGAPIWSIIVSLNEKGVSSPYGGSWGTTTIKHMLENPAYKGTLTWNRSSRAKFYQATANEKITRVEGRAAFRQRNPQEYWTLTDGVCEGLVTVEEWEAANARLRTARETPGAFRGQGSKSSFLASGIMFCGCGAHLSGASSHKKKNPAIVYRYYRCTTARTKGLAVCAAKLVRADVIDGYLERRIRELYHEPAVRSKLWREIGNQLDEALDVALDDKREKDPGEESVKIDTQITRIVNAIAEGVLNSAEAKDKLSALREEKAHLQRTAALTIPVVDSRKLRNRILEAAKKALRDEAALWEHATPELRKQIVRAHVKTMHVDHGKGELRTEFYPIDILSLNNTC